MTQTPQAAPGGAKPQRRGSFLSDKQVVEAALRGRSVTFRFLKSQPGHETTGYVVGKDDYHWMVACPRTLEVPGEDPITVQLVHKSADLIVLDSKETLSSLPDRQQTAIKKIGERFWASHRDHR